MPGSSENSVSMAHCHQSILKRRRSEFTNDLEFSEIKDFIISKNLLTENMIANIEAKPTRRKQIELFLDILPQRGRDAYEIFCESLKESYKHLYDMLLFEKTACLGNGKETFDSSYPTTATVLPLKFIKPEQRWREAIAENINRTRSKISLWPWTKHLVQIDDVFTELRWLKSVSSTEGVAKWSLQHYIQMFEKTNDGTLPKRILMQGRAGTGKSTVINKVAVDWARNVLNIAPKQEQPIPEYQKPLWQHLNSHQFLIPINLRNITKDMTLADTLYSQIPHLSEHNAKDLCDYIQENQSSLLFLFDGYDEYDISLSKDITALLHNESHLNCCVVLTSRPWKTSEIPNRNYIDAHIEVQGFSKANVKKYVKLYFQQTEDSLEKEQGLLEEIDKQNLWPLASIPVVIQLMCILRMHDQSLPKSVTQLYKEIVKFMIRIHLSKEDNLESVSDDQLLHDFDSVLLELGKLALEGLVENELLFEFKCTKHRISHAAWKMGFLAKMDDSYRKEQFLEFPHKSIQEFLAAYYVANDNSRSGIDVLKQHMENLSSVYDIQIVLIFLCGLDAQKGNEVLQKASEIAAESDDFKADHIRPGPVQAGSFKSAYFPHIKQFTKFLISCLKEYQDKSQVRVPLTALSVNLNDQTRNILRDIFSNHDNVKDIRLFCVCPDADKGCFEDEEDSGETSDETFQINQNSLHILSEGNVKVHISPLPNTLHTLCFCFLDCSSSIELLVEEISSKDELKTLCLVEAGLRPDNIRLLVNSLTYLNIEYLNLSGNMIQDAAIDIAKQLRFMNLKGIALIRARLNKTNIKILCEALVKNCQDLEVLDLSRNQIGNSFCHLVDILVQLPKLRRLKMQDCAITSESFLHFVDHLPSFKSLREVYLSWNCCDDSIAKIQEKAANFKHLKTVHMLAQSISPLVENNFSETMKQLAPNTTFRISPSLDHQRKMQKCWSTKSQSSAESLYKRSHSWSSTESTQRRESEPAVDDVFISTGASPTNCSDRRRHFSETEFHHFRESYKTGVDAIEENH